MIEQIIAWCVIVVFLVFGLLPAIVDSLSNPVPGALEYNSSKPNYWERVVIGVILVVGFIGGVAVVGSFLYIISWAVFTVS